MTNNTDKQYLDLCQNILTNGIESNDRTGTGTISLFGQQLRFNLKEGFPILTTKKMYFKGVKEELFWFLSGSTNCNDLPEGIRQWWSPWANENGDLGPIYGKQLRNSSYDQIQYIIDEIKSTPESRRHLVSTWQIQDVPNMNLPPCHGIVMQFYSRNNELSLHMYQRSADVFIGLPVNITSYSLLLSMIAQLTNHTPHELIISLGDSHIYKNHLNQVNTQLTRVPYQLPNLIISPDFKDINDLKSEYFLLDNYFSHSSIKGLVSI